MSSTAALFPSAVADRFPLSPGQESIWIFEQLTGDGRSPHQLPFGALLSGNLRKDILQGALDTLLRRHESLRARFALQDGSPVQSVASEDDTFTLAFHALSEGPPEQAAEAERRIVLAELDRPFDLVNGPLIRGVLMSRQAEVHVLLINLHHIVADGWSLNVLLRELSAIYNATVDGSECVLPPVAGRYVDQAISQPPAPESGANDAALRFWEGLMQGAPALIQLPTDRPRPPVQSCRCDVVAVGIGEPLAHGIRQLAARSDTSVFSVLMTAWALQLGRLTGETDLVIGTVAANRFGSAQRNRVGMYASPLPVRLTWRDDMTVTNLLHVTHRTTFAVLARQRVPFKRLVELLRPVRSLSHAPMFQVGLNLNTVQKGGNLQLAGLHVIPVDLPRTRSPYDLMMSLTDDGNALRGRLEFAQDLFDPGTAERVCDGFLTVLANMVANAAQEVGEVEILSSAARRAVLKLSWGPDRPVRGPDTMHGVFESQARTTPDAIALEHEGAVLTYAELNSRSSRLAHYLTGIGAGSRQRVAICVERSPLMVIAVLGVLKAGAAYVPLDPTYPRDRLAHMLSDVEPAAVLVDRASRGSLPLTAASRAVIVLDSAPTETAILACPTHAACIDIDGGTPAYIIYTSGSTGKPKGAVNHHSGLRNIVEAQREIYRLGPHSRILQVASFSFDVCLFEMMMALCHGGTLCLVPRAALLPVDPLVRTLKDLRITLVTLPPSALSHLPLGCLPESVDINVTGENFPPALAKAWAARHRVFNGYGPTETSIWASTFELGGADFPASVPIGRPLPNEQLYVLNDRSALCPIGVAGELYIGGTPVGLGYFRRESLTAERFVPDEHSGCGSLYRTGDIAKWLHDGNLQFLGRKDTQVKIRGFRIELGEVEALIGDIDGIREAAVILTGDLGEQLPRLVAFFATVKGAALSPEQVRERLRKFLPEFMVPTAFVGLPTLPVTPNGKVDRNALTSLVAAAPALDSAGSTAVPADLHEAMLHELYRDLLRQPDINAGTDFFASGGHSLLAVRLVSRLRERHGVALPVREVFANSVLGDLARVVAKYAVSSGASNLTLLRAGRDEGAIFFVHAGDGEVGYAHQLLPALSTTLSVYALSASGLLEGEAPLDSVEAMARRYVEAMRTVSHDGPFRLVGWSAGGTIAYEMARYIRQLGSVVVVLALLDTHRDYSAIIVDAVSRCAAAPRPSEVLSEWLRQASLQGLSAEASNHLDTMPLGDAVRSCHDQGHLPHEIDAPTLTRWWQVRQHTAVAVGDYRPAPIDCRTVLFSARDEQRTDDSLGWRELLGDRLEIVPVGGSHQSMVRAPNASPLGRALSAFLQPDASSRSPAAHATSARPTGIPDSSTAAGPIA